MMATFPEPSTFPFHSRKNNFYRAAAVPVESLPLWEAMDAAYRALCSILFNFVPGSGHPGGSLSSSRIVSSIIYRHLRYDLAQPEAINNDLLIYAAGHKAMGLYAALALRDEWVRVARPDLFNNTHRRLRLEDLLGFRRNPTQSTPLFKKFKSLTLDGHPTPLVPFIPIATGASGVGDTSAIGLAIASMDAFGPKGPRIHILEGEGGMTAGRVHEAIATAATAGLSNVIMHIDWNQASIDSNRVTAEGDQPGDYVQWDPRELLYINGWNVIDAGDGSDFSCVQGAQDLAISLDNERPTAIIYRTTKGWNYGIEGKASHGAGHPFCSEQFYHSVSPFEKEFGVILPRFTAEKNPDTIERAYWDTLLAMRGAFENNRTDVPRFAADCVARSKQRVSPLVMRVSGPNLAAVYASDFKPDSPPDHLALTPGKPATLRGVLGDTLGYLNRVTQGAFLACAADLFDSTSVTGINKDFSKGWYQAQHNPLSRLIPVGGICEDAMGGVMSGISSFGRHIGVSSSYSAFIAALEHVPARLHCIGQQMRREVTGEPYRTWIMINAHAGPMTGEDGPTHACPQPLQLIQDNFPRGSAITLTPWDPQEIWPLLMTALDQRPALLAPFVTRPSLPIPDRQKLGFPPAWAASRGVYALRRGGDRAIILQGQGVTTVFIRDVLPKLDAAGIRVNIFYVASAELFAGLSETDKKEIFPPELAFRSMGITDFTLPTLWRWVRSDEGIAASLYPHRRHGYLGSGSWDKVLEEAGLDGAGQWSAVESWVKRLS